MALYNMYWSVFIFITISKTGQNQVDTDGAGVHTVVHQQTRKPVYSVTLCLNLGGVKAYDKP